MKINKHITILILSLIVFTSTAIAQDFHLSHYDANPLYINPALTGMRVNEDWTYRINADCREQGGQSLATANTTVAAGFDTRLNNKFSIGEYVINNKSMNGGLNTLSFMASGAYNIIHPENKISPHHFSVGLQIGILYKSINQANFNYDSQYSSSSDNGFDTNIPSGENYTTQNITRLDANAGIYYRYYIREKKFSPFAGLSIYHLTQPNESFTGDVSKMPIRFNFHGGCYFNVSDEFTILPQFIYMYQANANELNLQLMGFYKIANTNYQPMIGASWRNKDAMVFHFGLKYKSNIFRFSYDSNISYLKNYNSHSGGLELSAVIAFNKKPTQHFESRTAK